MHLYQSYNALFTWWLPLAFLTNTLDISSKSCLFYNVSFKSITVHDNYNYEYFAFSISYVTSSATSREVFPTQHTLKQGERSIGKGQYLLFRRCKLNIKQILLLVLPYSILYIEFWLHVDWDYEYVDYICMALHRKLIAQTLA